MRREVRGAIAKGIVRSVYAACGQAAEIFIDTSARFCRFRVFRDAGATIPRLLGLPLGPVPKCEFRMFLFGSV